MNDLQTYEDFLETKNNQKVRTMTTPINDRFNILISPNSGELE